MRKAEVIVTTLSLIFLAGLATGVVTGAVLSSENNSVTNNYSTVVERNRTNPENIEEEY